MSTASSVESFLPPAAPLFRPQRTEAFAPESFGTHGRRMAQHFKLDAAPSLTTTTLSTAQIAVTRLASNGGAVGPTTPLPPEKAYLVTLHLRDLTGMEVWKEGRLAAEGPVAEGAVAIVHLDEEPVFRMAEAFDCLQFYIPEIVFDEMAEERGARRISALAFQAATPDPVMHQLGRALLPALERPSRAGCLFFDHLAFAAYSHLAVRYGALQAPPPQTHIRLSGPQERLAKELLSADLSSPPRIAAVARALGVPTGRFIRAFRHTLGAPPHRWVRGIRIEKAKDLLFNSALSLAQIAYECGFADQSHFTRVFARLVGMTPGAWRRARRQAGLPSPRALRA